MNRSITKTLLRKTQRSRSWLMIGGGLLVIGFGISLWLRQVSFTHAQSPNIFDVGRSNYFGRGESRNVDTVLPEIYDYREQSGGGLRSYAVNVRELTGLSDAVLHSLITRLTVVLLKLMLKVFLITLIINLHRLRVMNEIMELIKQERMLGSTPHQSMLVSRSKLAELVALYPNLSTINIMTHVKVG